MICGHENIVNKSENREVCFCQALSCVPNVVMLIRNCVRSVKLTGKI